MSHQPASVSKTTKQKSSKSSVCNEVKLHRSLGRSAVGDTDCAGINSSSGNCHLERLVSLILKRAIALLGIGDVKSSTIQLTKSLILVFSVRFFTKKNLSRKTLDQVCRSCAHTLGAIHHFASHPENRDQSFIKYWTDVLMCKAFGDEQRPPMDDWIDRPLFVGYLSYLVSRSLARRDVSFIYSLSKGSKRMWPALGDVKKQLALDKHKQRLSAKRTSIMEVDLAYWIMEASEQILFPSKVRKADRKKSNAWSPRSDVIRPRYLPVATKISPSLNACIQAGRKEGGAMSLFPTFEPSRGSIYPQRMLDTPLRLVIRQYDSWRDETWKRSLNNVYSRSFEVDSGLSDLEVVAIPEPGKFRIITKGDGFMYTALQPLQGQLLERWKKCPVSTMLIVDLTKKIQGIDDSVDEPLFCSVDYEAATDLLKRQCTELCLLPVGKTSPVLDLAFRSLQGGILTYPDGSRVECNEGQPMGHPLSFPLLCIINLAVYWTTLDRYAAVTFDSPKERQRFIHQRKWKVLVNGDDMLFKTNHSMYKIFLDVSKEAGLKASIGKNYLSETVCMINSQVFKRKGPLQRMERVGYLNLKFVTGASVKGGQSDANPCEIATEVSKMFELSPWTRDALPLIMSRWADRKFIFQNFKPNWYVPQVLGGYGIVPPPERKVQMTILQRKVATAFSLHPELSLIERRGVPARCLTLMMKWTKTKFLLVLPDNSSVVPLNYLPISEIAEGWLSRVLAMERAHRPMALVNAQRRWAGAEMSHKMLNTKLLVSQGSKLKKASLFNESNIERYRDAQVYASTGIFVPPLSALHLNPSYFDLQ